MTNNIPLNVLDEYAKTITTKQSNMLYENKLNKKFKKPLYENLKYQNDDNFTLYLSSDIINEANSTLEKVLVRYVDKHHLQYNIVNKGVHLYTPMAENYLELLEHLIADGFNKNSLKKIVDTKPAKKHIEQVSKNISKNK